MHASKTEPRRNASPLHEVNALRAPPAARASLVVRESRPRVPHICPALWLLPARIIDLQCPRFFDSARASTLGKSAVLVFIQATR